jgi:hypothetical protein
VVIEAAGIRFVSDLRQRHLLAGLRIEVQAVLGREGLVAYSSAFEPGGC